MKSHYLGIAALLLALLVPCLHVSEALASSDLNVSLSRDRAPVSVSSTPASGGGVVMGTQGENNGGDDNEGDPDEWGEGNGVKIYGAPKPVDNQQMVSRGVIDGWLAWVSHLLGVLSQWSR